MATTTQKGSKSKKAKPRRSVVKKSQPKQAENIQSLRRERDELLERETATSDILRMIAKAPADLQSLLDAIAERAARLCDSIDAQILRLHDDGQGVIASYGPVSVNPRQEHVPLDRGTLAGRSMLDRQTIHIHDIFNTPVSEYPRARELAQRHGNRTALATPLLRQGVPIGAILIRRPEVRPFSERQIKLLEIFADQAVIAIENSRLFQELTQKTTELESSNSELREALEHQTATAEVLGIISRSPTDVQPVLDAIVESAARVCGIDDVHLRLREGNTLLPRAHFGPIAIGRVEVSIDEPQHRWTREHGVLHVPDVRAQNDFPTLAPRPRVAHLLGRSPSSAWRTHWVVKRASHRSAPLHPGANQTARDFRRPGCHRD